jgi:hypothetical protein
MAIESSDPIPRPVAQGPSPSLTFPTSLHHVPPSLSEDVLAPPEQPDAEIDLCRGILGHGRECADRMRLAANTIHDNQTLTPAAQHQQAKAIAEKIAGPTLQRFTAALAVMDKKISALQSEVAMPVVEKNWLASPRHAARLTAFQAMPADQRRQTWLDAVDAGDEHTVASLLSEPGYVTGLSKGDLNELRIRWQQKAKPDAVKRLAQLETARDHLGRGADLLMRYSASLYATHDATLAEQQMRAADAALAAALQGPA